MKSWIGSIKAAVVCCAILLATSCGQKPEGLPQINGIQGPLFTIVDGRLIMTVKFLNYSIDGGLKAPIPETRNSLIEFSPNVIDGGMILALHMDAQDLADINIGVGDGNTLPDGRPLPGIPGGRLENSLRIDTQWHDVSFYYHKKLFGIWVPFGFETAGISGYWNMWFKEKNIGFLGVVGNDPVRNLKAGGVFLLRLENLKNRQLKKLIQLSERNPHLSF